MVWTMDYFSNKDSNQLFYRTRTIQINEIEKTRQFWYPQKLPSLIAHQFLLECKIDKPTQSFINFIITNLMHHAQLAEDKFAWLRDDEFARQAIAGVNPVNIERLKVFPPVSNLDPEVYGPQESSLKEEHILGQINGMTVQQVNYHVKMLTHHSDFFFHEKRIDYHIFKS